MSAFQCEGQAEDPRIQGKTEQAVTPAVGGKSKEEPCMGDLLATGGSTDQVTGDLHTTECLPREVKPFACGFIAGESQSQIRAHLKAKSTQLP